MSKKVIRIVPPTKILVKTFGTSKEQKGFEVVAKINTRGSSKII